MADDTRRVRRLRLTARDDALAQRGATLLADALHTASLPGGSGRVLVVRMLRLGTIRADRGPSGVALDVERRLRELRALAVYADDADATAAPAVYFRDELEPLACLAARIADGLPTDAWFWPLVVPGWSPAAPRDVALRQILAAALSADHGPAQATALLAELHDRGALDGLLAALRSQDCLPLLAAYGLRAQGGDDPPAALDSTGRPVEGTDEIEIAPAWRVTLARWAERWGQGDDRALWLAAAALVARRPAGLLDPRLGQQARAALRHIAGDPRTLPLPRQPAPHPPAAPLPPPSADIAPAQPRAMSATAEASAAASDLTPGREERLSLAGLSGTERPPDESAAPEVQWLGPGPGAPRPSACAGLFYLLPVLGRLGVADAIATDPDLLDLPARVLRVIALRLGAPAADPALLLLAEGLSAARGASQRASRTSFEGWIAAVRRWCRRATRMSLRAIVLRPGQIEATRTHLDVRFDLSQLDTRIRRAGIDINPGWVPWLGRVVSFHYEAR